MKELKMGRKLLRLLLSAVLPAALAAGSLTACGQSKYHAVALDPAGYELQGETGETAAEGEEQKKGRQEDRKEDQVPGSELGELSETGLGADGMSDTGENASGTDGADTDTAFFGDAGTEVALPDGAGTETAPSGDAETAQAELSYEPVDETVVVTADVLNVREAEELDARILVQLKAGDRLHRIGYTEEWSRVIYDGMTAYVASDMVEADASGADETAPAGEISSGEEGETAVLPNGHTVAIDAGCQAKANTEKEPIGPNSETMKAKMPEGSVGTVTGVPEYELTLAVAKELEQILVSRGYQVVMTRETSDVNLSDAERAEIANQSGAEIFIRLYANFMDNSGVYGALATCMTEQNPFHPELHAKSYTLSKKIVDNICAQTGTKNRGVQEADNSGAINWSEIPVTAVEMGFLSNPDEDRWLQDKAYREKLANGIAAAVDSYFEEGN